MAQYYAEENVINGTFAELWINGELLANATAFQAKISLKTADVNMLGTLAKHTKVIGYEGKGTLKLNKVDSMFIKLMADNIKKGKQTKVTIISKLADPDAMGVERVCIKDATFEELTLADWEGKKNGEESVPFSFSDYEVLDSI